jgi:tight adherence protein C
MVVILEKLLIPGLTFFSIMAFGIFVILAKEQKRRRIEKRLQDTPSEIEEVTVLQKRESGLMYFLEVIGNFVSHGHSSTSLWEELARAGYYSKAAPAIYTGIKMLLLLLGIGAMAIMIVPMEYSIMAKTTLISFGGICLFFVPNIVLKIRLKKRHDEICLHLPDAVDLLEICVSSGIGLAMAWNIVADEVEDVSPTLANAMALTNFEIHLGGSRIDAMRHMATRTGVQKLSSLAATLVQTERFGTSIATALKEFAQALREERYFTAEEHAEKMAVKMIIPMVLFIFPAIFIITVGPAVVQIAELFAGLM